VSTADPRTPPAGEEIHLPAPTLIPFVTAIAITLVVVGTTLSLIFSVFGLILLVACIVRWSRDTRRDVSELPEEHH
jgi:Flp pilus assembly protein TadB